VNRFGRLAGSDAELVVQTERPELEPNLSVASADGAAHKFGAAGGAVVVPPFEIAIGRCAVVEYGADDPVQRRSRVYFQRGSIPIAARAAAENDVRVSQGGCEMYVSTCGSNLPPICHCVDADTTESVDGAWTR
jgi:hypothetical protein